VSNYSFRAATTRGTYGFFNYRGGGGGAAGVPSQLRVVGGARGAELEVEGGQ
jgi:hypothetical protein